MADEEKAEGPRPIEWHPAPAGETAEEASAVSVGEISKVVAGPSGLTITGSIGGGSISSMHFPATATTNVPPAQPAVEHVLLPTRAPRRVLVAFFDGPDDVEPYWAAQLLPRHMHVDLPADAPEDAVLDLDLSLVKRFEQ